MQLSWNYNYGAFSTAAFGDKEVLLKNPGLVASDPILAYKAALWFWMTAQAPKPSCHDVMQGTWQPSKRDASLGRAPGYGMTTNIINGGLECGRPTNAKVEDRVGFFKRFAGILGAGIDESTLYCNGMTSYR
jgi:chitinase